MPVRTAISHTLLLCLALCACPATKTGELAIDRSTSPGQRLWYLALQVPGRTTAQVDQLVGLPLLRALSHETGAQVVGTRSGPARLVVYLRTSVGQSARDMVERALVKVSLPNGISTAQFGAAGPPGLAPEQPNPPMEPARLLESGLAPSDLLRALAREPAWFEKEPDAGPQQFWCAVRLKQRDQESLASAVDQTRTALRQELPHCPDPTQLGGSEILRLSDGSAVDWLLLPINCKSNSSALPPPACRELDQLGDGERAMMRWPMGGNRSSRSELR